MDEEISEGAEYSPKSEFSKPKLVEEAVRKCIEARSKEMRSGYYNYKTDQSGNPTAKIWIADSRQVFDAHIMALRNLLFPEIKADSKYKEKEKKIRKKKKEIFDKHCYTLMEKENHKWKFTKEKVIPEVDAIVVCPRTDNSNIAQEVKGGWNLHVTTYWNEMTLYNDRLFALLNDVVASLNYFKQRVSY